MSPVRTSLRPVSGRTKHVAWGNHSPVGERHALAPLEKSACGTVGDTEAVCRVDVEPAGPHGLDERVPDRGHPVLHRKRLQPVGLPFDDRPRLELDGLERVGKPAEDAAKRGQEVAQPSRAVDRSESSRPGRENVLSMPGSPR